MNNIYLLEKNRCTGCQSCSKICPHHCIEMKENQEGFLYPNIDLTQCTNCGVCVVRCPILTPPKKSTYKQKAFGLILKDSSVLEKSASGGAFAGIACQVLQEGGFVFGAAYDENLVVEHIGISSQDKLYKLQGSKYVAGNVKDSYLQVQDLLKNGKKVLYSGLPCQIAGLKAFLNREYENFITIDLICHGVPSQKLFSRYLAWLGKRTGGRILYYGFRDKDVAGWSCGGKFKTKTKTKTKTMEAACDPYYASFIRGETYRESCYNCQFATMERVGDLTIGDFWGVEHFYPAVQRKNGVSVVLVNTSRGKECFQKLDGCWESFTCTVDEVRKFNTNLNHPTIRPTVRDVIYEGIDEQNDIAFFKKFVYVNPVYLKTRRFVASILPTTLKTTIKRCLKK